jgi:formate dehydrogenase subunit beta
MKFPIEKRDTLIKGWLKALLEKEIVKGLVIPSRLPSGANAAQSLITDPAMVEDTDPFAPVMAVSTAKILSKMTRLKPMEKPIAILLRPCELRATIELTKLKQANLDNLLFISMDCAGTFSVKTHASLIQEQANFDEIEEKLFNSEDDPLLRPVCQGCEWSVPDNCDITIARLGLEANTFGLIAHTERGEAALAEMAEGESWETGDEARSAAVEKWIQEKIAKRDTQFAELRNRVVGVENLLKTYATCINCHNCMTVCPICFCKECFFDSAVFEFESDRFMDWSNARGNLRLPTDTLLFHIGRMNHMSTSCVACGMCQDACPNDIPVAQIFKMVGFNTQQRFDYVAGRNMDEPVPLAEFREDELHEIGGE